jgi:hypothetical protein
MYVIGCVMNAFCRENFSFNLFPSICPSNELNKLIGNKTITNYIKSQRLGWLGQARRMSDERMVKKGILMETHGNKIIRKTPNRWENDVKNDFNIMKIYNWKDCIQDRHKWKKIVEKAKTFNY